MSANLPVQVTAIGGALVEVLRWDQYQKLGVESQAALVELVKRYPDLNTENRVDLVVDLMVFHGETLNQTLREFVGTYSAELVYLAIDTLYEAGVRGCAPQGTAQLVDSLEQLEEVLEILDEMSPQPESPAHALALIEEAHALEHIFHPSLDDRP
jgi:hypothetical protein